MYAICIAAPTHFQRYHLCFFFFSFLMYVSYVSMFCVIGPLHLSPLPQFGNPFVLKFGILSASLFSPI